MHTYCSYDDKLADFVINEAMPYEIVPIACVATGLRPYGYFDASTPYAYTGIHLVGTPELLTYRLLQTMDHFVYVRYFDNDLLPYYHEEGSRVRIWSREWSSFLDALTSPIPTDPYLLDVIFLPSIHEVPIMSNIHPYLLSCVSKNIATTWIEEAKRELQHSHFPLVYFWLYRTIKLMRDEEFEWDFHALIEELGSTVAKQLLLEGILPPTDKLVSDISDVENKARSYQVQSRLSAIPDLAIIKHADDIIKRYRTSLF